MAAEVPRSVETTRERAPRSPEDTVNQARQDYRVKWSRMRTNIDEYKKSSDPKLKNLATRYEDRMKKAGLDTSEVAPTLDEAAVLANIQKIDGILDTFEQEPAVKFKSLVDAQRNTLMGMITTYPDEPYFKDVLKKLESTIKSMSVATTEDQFNQAQSKLSKFTQNEEYTKISNRAHEQKKRLDYLTWKIQKAFKNVTDFDTVETINARLKKATSDLVATTDPDHPGVFNDYQADKTVPLLEYSFLIRGYQLRLTRDGKLSLVGATLDAKNRNPRLAALPTEGKSLDRAKESDKKLAQEKYDRGIDALTEGFPGAALGYFKEAYSIVKSPNAHMMMVRCYSDMGFNAMALNEAQLALPEAEAAASKNPEYSKAVTTIKKLMADLPKRAQKPSKVTFAEKSKEKFIATI